MDRKFERENIVGMLRRIWKEMQNLKEEIKKEIRKKERK